MLAVPVVTGEGRFALLALKAAPGTFRKGDLELVERLAGLAVRAEETRGITDENKLLAASIAGSNLGFTISDAAFSPPNLIYVNGAFERLTGYGASEVLGGNLRHLSDEPLDVPERVRLRETIARKESGQFVLRNRHKDGHPYWIELSIFPVSDEAGTVRHFVATQNDVSERIAAEEERDRSRARMARALAATEDAFLILEADGRVAFANAAVEALFPAPGMKWAQGTRFETNWQAYLEGCADLPGAVASALRQPDLAALAARPTGFEIDLPDGRSVLLTAADLEDGGRVVSATDVTPMKSAQRLLSDRLAAIEAAGEGIAIVNKYGRLVYLNPAAAALLGHERATQALGKSWTDGYDNPPADAARDGFSDRLTRQVGERLLTHDVTCTALKGGGAVLVLRDITEELEIEAREEEMRTGLLRVQRQEAIAQLTAGIAHDFNNLLSAINGSATLIGMEPDLPDPVRGHVDRIAKAGVQAARLVNRMLDLGTPGATDGKFSLAATLRDLPTLLETSLSAAIRFEMDASEHLLILRGDPGGLSQALVNLALNARDAMPEAGGTITLSVDTGGGMDAPTLAKAFDPYFTTKGRRGTGIGLASVAMQVQAVGGGVDIASAPGEGTVVTIYWPLAPARDIAATTTGGGADHDLTGRTILIVDDDPQVGQVLASYLEAQGAEAAICEDPRDALEAIKEDPHGWSALITDYDMPHMNGGELAERAGRAAPDLPIFVATALARRLNDPRLADGLVAGIFPKPVDLDLLCAALEDSTEGKRTAGTHAASTG